MADIHPRYIVDENQARKGVVLTMEEWEQILEDLEELEDIRACEEADANPEDEGSFSPPPRGWRHHHSQQEQVKPPEST